MPFTPPRYQPQCVSGQQRLRWDADQCKETRSLTQTATEVSPHAFTQTVRYNTHANMQPCTHRHTYCIFSHRYTCIHRHIAGISVAKYTVCVSVCAWLHVCMCVCVSVC